MLVFKYFAMCDLHKLVLELVLTFVRHKLLW